MEPPRSVDDEAHGDVSTVTCELLVDVNCVAVADDGNCFDAPCSIIFCRFPVTIYKNNSHAENHSMSVYPEYCDSLSIQTTFTNANHSVIFIFSLHMFQYLFLI